MWFRKRDDDDVIERRDDDVIEERTGASPGLVRALFTLAGVAAAGALIWTAQLFDLGSTDEFWGAMAMLAAAGLALGLSQLFGGWTKWGWPTFSPMVFLIGFVPTFVVGAWLLLARQPDGGWEQSRVDGWTDDLGLTSFANDLATFLPVVPVIVGLVLAFAFDTTGPRTRIVHEHEHDLEHEQVVATPTTDETVAEELRREREERDEPEAETVVVGGTDDSPTDPPRRDPTV